MKFKTVFKPFIIYFNALGTFYSRSLKILFARHPNLDGSLQDFQMQRGILLDLAQEHWNLIKTVFRSAWVIVLLTAAIGLKYLNLVFCVTLLLTAPIWTPFSLAWGAYHQRRLDNKFKAKAKQQMEDL